MPTHTNICNLWWFFASFKLNWFHQTPGMFSIIGFWLRCRVHPKNDISTWIKLSFPFLDQLIISDHEVPATCIHGAAFIWDDLVWATTSLGDAWHHGFTNISVLTTKGINAQCRRCLLCSGRHVLMSEQCSERILLGHHHIQEIQKTVTHHTWIWLQPSIPPT